MGTLNQSQVTTSDDFEIEMDALDDSSSDATGTSNVKNRQNTGLISTKTLLTMITPDHGIFAAAAARKLEPPFGKLLPSEVLNYFTLYAQKTQTSVDTLIAAYFAGLSGVIGRTCLVHVPGDISNRLLPLNIFLKNMASTSNGKSYPVNVLIRDPMLEVQRELEQQRKHLKPKTRNTAANNKGPIASRKLYNATSTYSAMVHILEEHGECVISNDEASSTMSAQLTQITRGANLTKPLLMASFGGGAFDTSYAEMDYNFDHPFITYLASVQEFGMIKLIIEFCLENDGFLDRFIHLTSQLPDRPDYLLDEAGKKLFEEFVQGFGAKPKFEDYFAKFYRMLILALRKDGVEAHEIMIDEDASRFLADCKSDFVNAQREMDDFASSRRANNASLGLKDMDIPVELKTANSKMTERVLKLTALAKIGMSAANANGDPDAFLADASWKMLRLADLLVTYDLLKVCDAQMHEYVFIANSLRKQGALSLQTSKKASSAGCSAKSKAQNALVTSPYLLELIRTESRLTGEQRAMWFLAQILKIPGPFLSEAMIRKQFGTCSFYSTDFLLEALKMTECRDNNELHFLALFKRNQSSRYDVLHKLPPEFLLRKDLCLLEAFLSIDEYKHAYSTPIGQSCFVSGVMQDKDWGVWVTNRQKESPFLNLRFDEKIVDLQSYQLKFGDVVTGRITFAGNVESCDVDELMRSRASENTVASTNDDGFSGQISTPSHSQLASLNNSPNTATNSPLMKKSRVLLGTATNNVFLEEVVVGENSNVLSDEASNEASGEATEQRQRLQKMIGLNAMSGKSAMILAQIRCYQMPKWKPTAKFF